MSKKLSLSSAVLININVMLGSGIFINTVELVKRAGGLGFVAYIIIAIMMLPLIACIAKLVQLYPVGGFYAFGTSQLGSLVGFLGTWAYTVAKLASPTLMIHASMSLCQQILPVLQYINIYILDVCILSLFIGLNMFDIKTGSSIQKIFLGLKIVPISFAILASLYIISGGIYHIPVPLWSGIPLALPLVLYAATGFESTAALSSKIENPSVNGPRAIFISYAIVMFFAIIYQFLFYSAVGNFLADQVSYLGAFPSLLKLLPSFESIAHATQIVLNLTIASSALGGSYGILYSNTWNINTLAHAGHLYRSDILTRLNKHHIPYYAVLLQGLICLGYLGITGGYQVPLQQTSAFGCIIAYTISALALIRAVYTKKADGFPASIAYAGLLVCSILAGVSIYNFMINGTYSLLLMAILLIAGIGMYFHSRSKNRIKREIINSK
ncbi:APC family permease [Vermiphilus pyriformis]|nr:MAG: APC family permease [Vermiphilus pyriformis]